MTPLRRTFAHSAPSSADRMVKFADTHTLAVAHLPDAAACQLWPESLYASDDTPDNVPFARRVKRVLDPVAAAIGLVLLYPLLLTIALIIRLESPGPALFTQPRVGCRQKIFNCYKFRSMYHHMAEPCGTTQATRNDVRVTRFGRFLRRTSLDELPQLLNVLKGEMSLVGPRPHAPNTRAGGSLFAEVVPNYNERHCVRPGITGWAQVNGWRGETRTPEDIQMRVRYDMDYIRDWSLLFDLRILLLTLVRMFNDDTAV
jgi:exopolysaccharide biosynthesis polyprenyl glycosylphosphotransferase